MNNNDNNIDDLFEREASTYEYTPSDEAWENIKEKLDSSDEKSSVPIIKLMQVAAAAIFILLAAYFLLPTAHDSSQEMTEIHPQNEAHIDYSASRSRSIYRIYRAAKKGKKFNKEAINF